MRLDPRLIVDFATIAEEGSFTKAAARLRVAQPWLSARLGKLEDVLGFRLLERTTRSVRLTDRGAQFLQVARDVSEACDAADRMALRLQRSERRVLRIGAAPYTRIISQRHRLLSGFAADHGDVHVELETGWSHALINRLNAGGIDLTFIMGDHWPEYVEGIVLRRYGVALSVALDHRWAGRISVPPADLRGEAVQVFTRSLYPQLWDELYAPLIGVGARFIEMPEMAEGPPARMNRSDEVAAFFDFGADDPGTSDVCRIPLDASVAIPFQLARRTDSRSPDALAFWQLAQSLAADGV
jgi:DNA-binding transcriptional LysR family regulator